MAQSEAHHLQEIYQRLTTDSQRLTQQLAELTATARAMKQQLNGEGHLDLGTFSDQLETFASIEAGNRQIDALNARHDTAVTRLATRNYLASGLRQLQLDFGDGVRRPSISARSATPMKIPTT